MAQPQKARQGGFTLIEILIALLLLSIGLLGTAQLQFTSFQEGRNALYRNQATVIAEDMIDRARGNPTGFSTAGAYAPLAFNPASSLPAGANCAAAACNTLGLAAKDVREWALNFVTATPSLPAAAGTTAITRGAVICGGADLFVVTVTWVTPDPDRAGDNATESVEMRACL